MFTTIIKTNNSEDYLYDVLEAVKASGEIIVVDEYSADDTVKIAREYKAKIVYSYRNELSQILNQTTEEASYDWILFLSENEIADKNLFENILKYSEKPKKNRGGVTLPFKLFYLAKEIKSARKKSVLRFFDRNMCSFDCDTEPFVKLKKGKIYRFNRWMSSKKGFIIKHKSGIFGEIQKNFEKNMSLYKAAKERGRSVFFAPLARFLNLYVLKGGLFDGKRGFIYCLEEAISKFILSCAEFERGQNDCQHD